MIVHCPNCNHPHEINPASLLGSIMTPKKILSNRANAKKAGRKVGWRKVKTEEKP